MFDVLSDHTCSSPTPDEFRGKVLVNLELSSLEPGALSDRFDPSGIDFTIDPLVSCWNDPSMMDINADVAQIIKRKKTKRPPIVLHPFESLLTVELAVQVLKDICKPL